MQEFVKPDWNESIDVDALRSTMNPKNQVRGVFFGSAIKLAKEHGTTLPGHDSYSTLRSYPSTELFDVLVHTAQTVFPDQPLKQGLRMIGQRVFANLREIAATTFLFSVAGRDVRKLFGLVDRAYGLLSRGVSAKPREEDGAVIIELRNITLFADSYHFGIFEGILQYHKTPAEMLVRRHNLHDVDIKILFKNN